MVLMSRSSCIGWARVVRAKRLSRNNRYSVRTSLNDSPSLLVKEMSEIMGVNLNENDILIANRLPPTEKVKDRLIVKFTRKEKSSGRETKCTARGKT